MSFEKIAAAAPEPAKISFYYTVQSLLDDATLRSIYEAKNMGDEKTPYPEDEFALSADEELIFKFMMGDAVRELFRGFLKYAYGISTPIAHDVEYTPDGEDPVQASYFQIVDTNNYGGTDAYIEATDEEVKRALRSYILRDWFVSQGKAKNSEVFNAQYVSALRGIKQLSFYLKKPVI